MGYRGASPNIGPDGGTSPDYTPGGSTTGIAEIVGPQGALVGVFTSNTLDLRNIPPKVDYRGDAQNIPALTPMLQQPFLVGSGVTAGGITKTWITPTGATRLYLGILDYATATNTGSFTATVSFAALPDIPSNPVRVSGVAQIQLAAALAGSSAYSLDTAPLDAPARVQVPLIAGQALLFTAWGTVGYRGETPNISPEGGTSTDYTPGGSASGIAEIVGPRGALVGVFTRDTLDSRSIPPRVDYSSAAARDRSNFTPLLQQPFFIGSGLDSTGVLKRILVPNGATRLYLGVLDYATATNTGAFAVAVSPDAPGTPTFSGSGVLNAAGFGPNPLAPGSIAAIFGANLATETQLATSVPLPTSISGTRAYFDLFPAPLYFVSFSQANMQVPFELNAQQARLTIVRNGSASLPIVLSLSPYAPGIFTAGDGSPIIVNYRTGALVSAAQPVRPGDVLIIYATGVGPISNPPPSGIETPLDKTFQLAVPVIVAFGSKTTTADFAGLAPGLVGVCQVNVTIPALSPGQTTLQLQVGGASSNSVPLYVSQ